MLKEFVLFITSCSPCLSQGATEAVNYHGMAPAISSYQGPGSVGKQYNCTTTACTEGPVRNRVLKVKHGRVCVVTLTRKGINMEKQIVIIKFQA